MGCPMRCAYCGQASLDRAYAGPRVLEFDDFITCMGHVAADAQISFASFAEPYLNPNLSNMLMWLYDHGRNYQIFTTLYSANRDDIDVLRQTKPDHVTLHIPAADDKMNLAVTPDYLELVRYLLAAPPCDDLQVVCFGPWRGDLEFAKPFWRDLPLQSRAGNIWPRPRLKGPMVCGQTPLLRHPTLLPSGDIDVCCQDYKLLHILGNLLHDDIRAILGGEKTNAIRAAMAGDGDCVCRRCEYARPVKSA